jgi:hypothetical protein
MVVLHYFKRIWEPAPQIGTQLAEFSRRYFFTGALLAFAIVSSYAWAQFPYDNICFPDSNATTGVAGIYDNVQILNDTVAQINVEQNKAARFCNQDWRKLDGIAFPMTARVQYGGLKWMSSSQETLSNVYGITSVIALILFIVIVFGGVMIKYILSWRKGMYKPSGEDQMIDFSNAPEISAYVPFMRVRAFPYPLLACDIDDLPQTLIGWTDKDNSYDVHNIIFDVPYENMKRTRMIVSKTAGNTKISEHEDYHESLAYKVATEATEEDAAKGRLDRVQPRPIFSIIRHYSRPLTNEK